MCVMIGPVAVWLLTLTKNIVGVMAQIVNDLKVLQGGVVRDGAIDT